MIKQQRIVIKCANDIGSTLAYVMDNFINAIMKKRNLAFDGQRWFCQPNKRSPFAQVGEDEVPEQYRNEMNAFLENKRKQS